MSPTPEDDLIPASVQLGDVVPPDDPEDWTRPLTWVAAAGMLAAPLAALAWFGLWPPGSSAAAQPGTWLLAGALVAGAVLTGATQQGGTRALTGTLAAGLFVALATIVAGVVTAGGRQVAEASPTVAHALAAALSGLGGVTAASPLAAVVASARNRGLRVLVPAAIGAAVSALLVALLFAR